MALAMGPRIAASGATFVLKERGRDAGSNPHSVRALEQGLGPVRLAAGLVTVENAERAGELVRESQHRSSPPVRR